jgi:hypothetical protein
MKLELTDVSALTLDARSARLELGRITVVSDGRTRFEIAHLRRGTEVLEHHRVVARAGTARIAVVSLPKGKTVLVLVRPTRAHSRPHKQVRSRRQHPAFTG